MADVVDGGQGFTIGPDEKVRCTHCDKQYAHKNIENPKKHPCAKEYEAEIAERHERAAREGGMK